MALTQVPAGMISSVAGSTLTGSIPNSAIPSGSVVQVAYDYISINGTRSTQTYTSSTVITPVASFSKVYVVATVDNLISPNAYGTYGDYPIYASPGLTLSNYTVNSSSTFTAITNAGSQIASNQWIKSGNSASSFLVVTKTSGSWTTANTFSFAYTVGPVYGGTNWGNMSIIFYLIA